MSGAVAETVAGETVERKLDPEVLAIRARPIRAIRFKRGLIVGLAGAAVIVLVVIAWFALKPHVFRVVAQPEAVAEPEARPPVDALGTLPKTYATYRAWGRRCRAISASRSWSSSRPQRSPPTAVATWRRRPSASVGPPRSRQRGSRAS